eukprot:2873681-Amphidinium_carterae.1
MACWRGLRSVGRCGVLLIGICLGWLVVGHRRANRQQKTVHEAMSDLVFGAESSDSGQLDMQAVEEALAEGLDLDAFPAPAASERHVHAFVSAETPPVQEAKRKKKNGVTNKVYPVHVKEGQDGSVTRGRSPLPMLSVPDDDEKSFLEFEEADL